MLYLFQKCESLALWRWRPLSFSLLWLSSISFVFCCIYLTWCLPLLEKEGFLQIVFPCLFTVKKKVRLEWEVEYIANLTERRALFCNYYIRNQPFLWRIIRWKVLGLLSVRLSRIFYSPWIVSDQESTVSRLQAELTLNPPTWASCFMRSHGLKCFICQFLPPVPFPAERRGAALSSKAKQGPAWALVPFNLFLMFSVSPCVLWVWTQAVSSTV